jgi:SAM-dependent methyltransferase
MSQPQLAEKPSVESYTFGDSDLAAERLRLLAAAFAPSSRAFVARLGREPVRLAIDLGCGPGYTTALLAAGTGAGTTIGLDTSPRFLARAWRQAARGVAFAEHDVTRAPFPAPPADLIYGRFVVTHLPDAGAAIATWANALVPRGRLAFEEVDAMTADDPVLLRYYQLVEAMQAARGQRTYVGRDLAALAPAETFVVERADTVPVTLPAPVAARLHALNFRTWRQNPFVVANVAAAELDRLGDALEALASGARAAAPVRWKMAQVILRLRDPQGPQGVPRPPR